MKHFDKYTTRGPDYHYKQIGRSSLKNYNAFVDARFQKLLSHVERFASGKKPKILDVGSGDGVALYLLRDKLPGEELFGIEPVKEALEVAKSKVSGAQFTQGSAEKLPYENDSFDIVISSDVIEHVDDPEQMLEEIKRVAKEDAVIIVGTPIRHTKTPVDHNHVQEWFVEDFQALMEKYFKNVEMHESHELSMTLRYNAPTRFKYLINFFSLSLGWNPFLKERENRIQMFSYMYAVCRK